jgi:hypothetical protein
VIFGSGSGSLDMIVGWKWLRVVGDYSWMEVAQDRRGW